VAASPPGWLERFALRVPRFEGAPLAPPARGAASPRAPSVRHLRCGRLTPTRRWSA